MRARIRIERLFKHNHGGVQAQIEADPIEDIVKSNGTGNCRVGRGYIKRYVIVDLGWLMIEVLKV